MQVVALSSSDGRYNITVAGDDSELIASMLLLLEVPGRTGDRALDQVAYRRNQRSHTASPAAREHPAA
jgi:hypothetical protein